MRKNSQRARAQRVGAASIYVERSLRRLDGRKEPDPADYTEEDYQKFQEIISGEEQE